MGRKLKKVGNFLKKRRREIIIGVCGITGGLIGYKLSKPTIPMKIWDKSSVKKIGEVLSDVPGKVGGVFELGGYTFIGIDDIPIEKAGELGEKIANKTSLFKNSANIWVAGGKN